MSRTRFARLGGRSPAPAGVALLAAALVLYLVTLDNGLRPDELKGGDLITHQYAQVQARPSNAPGYPLFTMGGWLWFRVGRALLARVASPIQVLSLYSTIWAVASLALMYILALRAASGRWPLAAAGTAFYAVTYFFWYYAVTTEQYASAVFQTLLLLLLALKWRQSRRGRLLYAMAFVSGTALANMVTVALILPALAVYVLSIDRGLLRRPRLLVRLALAGALPLLSYAYVYMRGAQHPEWRGVGQWSSTWQWFLSFISTGQGRGEMTLRLLPLDLRYLALVPGELTWPMLLAGLAGIALFRRREALLLYLTIGAYLAFSYIDRYGNWFQVVMPAYPLIVLGAVRLMAWAVERAHGRPIVTVVATLMLLALAGERLVTNWPRADQSDLAADTALCPGEALLADAAFADSSPGRVATTYDEQLSLQYLTIVYGYRSTLDAVPVTAIDDRVRYLTRAVLPLIGHLPPGWDHPDAMGAALLGRSEAGVDDIPTPMGPLAVTVRQYEVRERSWQCGGRMLVALVQWSVGSPPGEAFVVSARPLLHGQAILLANGPSQDDHLPLWGAVDAAAWRSGDLWLDSYSMPLPAAAEPDGIRLIAYSPADPSVVLWQADVPLKGQGDQPGQR